MTDKFTAADLIRGCVLDPDGCRCASGWIAHLVDVNADLSFNEMRAAFRESAKRRKLFLAHGFCRFISDINDDTRNSLDDIAACLNEALDACGYYLEWVE